MTGRDHTTDQLSTGGDDYIEKDHDPAGEKKVTATGHLTEGREYRCRTFFVPGRGDKLFMLATECARVLVFRDSYLLFNKNKSLHKIIASQPEKDDLIRQEILPYSYRSRQIAIVTARSMYRQFGARLINDGRRVKDDYWEASALAQGFTEDDYAVERKPPEKPKVVKDVAGPGTDITSTGLTAMQTLSKGEIVYKDPPEGVRPPASGPVDSAPRAGQGSVLRPRQELSGAPYEDKSQTSNTSEIVNHAAQAAQSNLAQMESRKHRERFFSDFYSKERKMEMPQLAPAPSPQLLDQGPPVTAQDFHHSPQQQRGPSQSHNPQHHLSMQQTPSQAYNPAGAFARLQSMQAAMQQQNNGAMANMHMQTPTPMSHQAHQRAPSFAYKQQMGGMPNTPTPGGGAGPGMFYPGNPMWASQQQHMPQAPSPLNAGNHHGTPMGYAQSPHMHNNMQGYGSPMNMTPGGLQAMNMSQLSRGMYPQGGGNVNPNFMQGGMGLGANMGMGNMGMSMGQPNMGAYMSSGPGLPQTAQQGMGMPQPWNGAGGAGGY